MEPNFVFNIAAEDEITDSGRGARADSLSLLERLLKYGGDASVGRFRSQ